MVNHGEPTWFSVSFERQKSLLTIGGGCAGYLYSVHDANEDSTGRVTVGDPTVCCGELSQTLRQMMTDDHLTICGHTITIEMYGMWGHAFEQLMAGWWFGTFFIFPYIGNNHE